MIEYNTAKEPISKILQISTVTIKDCPGYYLVALCANGSVWEMYVGGSREEMEWVCISGFKG
jgi:hypothetical protein